MGRKPNDHEYQVRMKSFLFLALAAGVLACSTSDSDDTGTGAGSNTSDLSDCEALCEAGEKVKCGGQACLDSCEEDRSKAEGGCQEQADAYFACARKSDSVSCSGGLLSFYGCTDEEAAFYQCLASQPEGGGGAGGGG